ncbi:hypothetical protein RhiirA5_435747 [Rhizophagus irregularis]|uniref:Uncharacterized protein n=1 Tax=Rhizophagus irregularis TaxID=588596 RepID=A0A2N0NMY1_9GLOM|nr:hypothetical protein RhiirA5_435747 [Rhizophagus irregularis]
MFDLAYSELLDMNQELCELEQCYRTISFQDKTIIAHENEIEELKSEISNLRKQLRVLQQDKKFKDEVGSIQDGRIIEDIATTNLIANINRGLDRIENHIRGVGTPIQNPANVIDGIRGSLNTIRVTL